MWRSDTLTLRFRFSAIIFRSKTDLSRLSNKYYLTTPQYSLRTVDTKLRCELRATCICLTLPGNPSCEGTIYIIAPAAGKSRIPVYLSHEAVAVADSQRNDKMAKFNVVSSESERCQLTVILTEHHKTSPRTGDEREPNRFELSVDGFGTVQDRTRRNQLP